MDVMYTDIGLEFNFNRVYQEAYRRCRADIMCDFNLGSLPSFLNQLSSQIMEDRGSQEANEFMQASLEDQDETLYRKLFLTFSKSLNSLDKQI